MRADDTCVRRYDYTDGVHRVKIVYTPVFDDDMLMSGQSLVLACAAVSCTACMVLCVLCGASCDLQQQQQQQQNQHRQPTTPPQRQSIQYNTQQTTCDTHTQ